MIKTPQGLYQFQIFNKSPEIIHGVSTKKFGNMKMIPKNDQKPELFLKQTKRAISNLENFAKIIGIQTKNFIAPMQVHGGEIKKVEFASILDEAEFPFIVGPADGLVTDQKGVFLFVAVADCFPIFAYDLGNQIIGIAHAGWKGIKGQVAKNLIQKMRSLGASPKDIVVGIGPGICVDHYEVKNDVSAKFDEEFQLERNTKRFLDLEKAIIYQLRNSGVKKENIEIAGICVFENDEFFSYRRDRTNDRFAAVIGIKEYQQVALRDFILAMALL